jgi:hypothetical protein
VSLIVVDEPRDRPAWIRESLALLARRVREERARLLARVTAASDEDLARGSDEDWGLGQVATHALVVERGVVSIALRLARGEAVERGTGQPRPPASGVSRGGIASLAEKAERDLARFEEDFPDDPDMSRRARHPFFGEMNCFGWLLTLPTHYAAHFEALDRGTASAL